MNHTPGPWTHNFGQDGWLIEAADEEQTYRVACVFEDIGAYRIPDADNRDDEGEANARFIVQACNSHDELLEALREIDDICMGKLPLTAQIKEIARAAIAKAGVGE
jgi:hypothetical protein